MFDPVQPATPLPTSAPVVIVGGGIVGAASALFLQRQGIPSIILEAADAPGTRTTAMSAHCIRAQFSEPDNIQMMAESLTFYERFTEECPGVWEARDLNLTQQGYLFASTEGADQDAFRERVRQQAAAGLPDVEALAGEDVVRRFPWMSGDIAVATFRARDGWLDSGVAVRAMLAAADVPFHPNSLVTEIVTAHNQVVGVRTAAGTIKTERVVLAAGPWCRILSPEPLPLVLWRRHRIVVSPHPDIPQQAPVTIDANSGAHWRPHRGGALAAWALPEPGTEPMWPVPADPAFIDLILRSERGIGRISPFWRDLGQRISNDDVLLTAGQYTMTPDHRPLIGPASHIAGLYLHTGYSGHGIMGSPAGARILAEEIAGTCTVNHFHPSRFDGNVAPPDVERVVI
jgi:sarcosine oxidase subunit beta